MKCYICKSKDVKTLYKLKGYQVLKCNACGLRFTYYPRKYEYEKKYFRKEQKKYFEEANDSKIKIFKSWLKEIEKFKKPGKILDVGCATGEFLNIAKEQGWDTYGVDVSKYAIDYTKNKYKIKAKVGELTKTSYKKDFFDVVFLSFIIEHIDNSSEVVGEANRLLKKQGIIFISTINEDSLLVKAANFIYKVSLGLIKKPVELLHPMEHLTHFSEKDLRGILNKSGFEILKLEKLDLPPENFQGGIMKDILLKVFYFFQRSFKQGYIIYTLARKTN